MAQSDNQSSAFERRIGSYSEGRPGPLLIVIGGVHGNEPAGVFAARRVLARLAKERSPIAGRFVAFAGNLGALPRRHRFLEADLNRIWQEEEAVTTRREVRAGGSLEAGQRDELLDAVAAEIDSGANRRRGAIILDLHSTSAHGSPFCVMADTLRNRKLAGAIGMPVILGLEETISGTMIEYFCELGHVAICLEGGQHEEEATVDNHESAIWIALVATGLLRAGDVPDLAEHRRRLRDAVGGVPGFVEVTHRHGIPAGHRYEMLPGFTNFQPIEKDRLLAHEGNGVMGEVRAPSSGLLLMPLYQPQGDEGYFMTRPVRRMWLRLSRLLRGLGLEWLLLLLPGVRRDPNRRRTIRVDRRVARRFAPQLFHLFGYRRCRPEGEFLLFSRRVEGPADV
jgi:succinylglutamate desuccinylase